MNGNYQDIFEQMSSIMSSGLEASDEILQDEDPTQHEFVFVLPMHLRGIYMFLVTLQAEWHELDEAIENACEDEEKYLYAPRFDVVNSTLEALSSLFTTAVNERIPERSKTANWIIVRGWRIVLFRETATHIQSATPVLQWLN